ncbi:MAG: glycosyltransferase family 4 protein [Sinobacteraceae bacterium]|nr:glycosyltransferase family 4 protein [Nevskiaceae bacterium]MCP5339591.1 glycosyltransferase family 4 protein [Nevskiaceae bacterium]
MKLESARILLVAPQPFFVERGTPIAVRLLAQTLVEQGHIVDLLTYHDGTDLRLDGVNHFRAGRPPGIGAIPVGISWQKLIADLWLIASMVRLLRRQHYTVVHAVEEAVFPAVVLNMFSTRKLVYDMDSSLVEQMADKWWLLRPFKPLFTAIERAAVRRCHMVVAVCEDLAVRVRPWVGAERVVVLPDVPVGGDAPVPADLESLRQGMPQDALLGLYVGNLERYQGIDLLLHGLAQAQAARSLQVVVVGGSAAHVEQYQRMAAELGVAERVRFLGPRPLSLLPAYLAQADILLSPRTLGQNTPMKVYSYMQAGKAILATDIRSHTQALDAACAELVAPEPQAVAAGLSRLVADAAHRARLGAAARERVEREFSLRTFRGRLAEAYAILTGGSATSSSSPSPTP